MNSILKKINTPIVKHSLFWVIVYVFYTTSALQNSADTESILVSYIFHTILQAFVAYAILYIIVPNYKKNKNGITSLGLVALLFFVVQVLLSTIKILFLENAYPTCFANSKYVIENVSFLDRITDVKAIFGYNPFFYLQPLFFLVALQFYEKQQKLSEINEQKKIVELKALKQQLNPHFLFNTLNNLYALTLEKSDTAPEVIEKLSSILDYMLYKCDDKYVSIQKEIELIENYLILEQVRYEDRVLVSFKNSITEYCKIAPLLLLTFIENAFKHGVSQELKMATIKISLTTENDTIIFNIFNTKPSSISKKESEKKAIGLQNVQQQLDLLYPNAHDLKIEETLESFLVILKLKKR